MRRRSGPAVIGCGAVLAFVVGAPRGRAASSDFHDAVATSAPALHYRFDETTGNAINHGSLGNTFDAVYNGTVSRSTPTWTGDDAVSFDDANDYLESLTTAPAAFTGNPSFSAEAVLFVPYNGSAALWAPLLHWGPSNASPTAQSVYFAFSHYEADEAYAGFYNGGLQSPSGSMPRGYWHHFVWVRTGGGTDLQGTVVYIDGVDVSGSLVADPNLCCNGSTPNVGSTAFRVNRARDFEASRYFVGSLDEVALYGRALTQNEVETHFVALNWIFADMFETGGVERWTSSVPIID